MSATRVRSRSGRLSAKWLGALAVVSALAALGACTPSPPLNGPGGELPTEGPEFPVDETTVRLNQIQMIGSHNSYHIAPSQQILDWLKVFSSIAPEAARELGDPATLNYTHPPITTQLERGLRTFELDVFADPLGGRFAHPVLPRLLKLGGPRPSGVDEPGMKVLHIQDIDFMSRCPTLISCLEEMRTWSDTNPGHLPIIVNIELKDDPLPAPFDATKIAPFDSAALDRVDAEIISVLGDRLMTPDSVRGDAADLNTVITTTGWPTLAESRGKFLFFIDNENKRDAYLSGHPALEGRVMFTSSGEGQPDGAILKVNDPGDGTRIQDLVRQGYIVRTRADDDVTKPSVLQREMAFASGAQVIHSDFPQGQMSASGYTVTFGTNPAARCNPISAGPALCDAIGDILRLG